MRTIKSFTILFILIFANMSLVAQDETTVERNVTVEREYQPVINDAGKITSNPQVLEPVITKTPARYSDFNYPLSVAENIHTLSAAELMMQRQNNPQGFARIGLGNGLNTLAEVGLPIVKTSDLLLDFQLNHQGMFGDKMHSNSNAALSVDKIFRRMTLYGGLGGGHEYFNYYGNHFNNDSIVDIKGLSANYGTLNYKEQNLTRITRDARTFDVDSIAALPSTNTFYRLNAFVGLGSLPLSKDIRYNAEVHYNLFAVRDGLNEHDVVARAKFETPLELNRAGVDIEMHNLFYRSDVPELMNFWRYYAVFDINPYYNIERERYDLRLGVKSAFSFIHGKPFNPAADIRFEWRAIPEYFAFYAGVGGDYEVNTMGRMFAQNRFIYNDLRIKDTYTPLDAYAGIKLKPVYNLLLDAFVNYKYMDAQHFFVNKEYATDEIAGSDSVLYSNRFNVIYRGASQLRIGARANLNVKNIVNFQLKGVYNDWKVADEEYAWLKPKWEADLGMDIRASRNFNIGLNVFYQGERYAKLGQSAIQMDPFLDVNLGVSYSYSNWLSMFAKMNNILNQHYQYFYGYDVQGANVLVGASFSF